MGAFAGVWKDKLLAKWCFLTSSDLRQRFTSNHSLRRPSTNVTASLEMGTSSLACSSVEVKQMKIKSKIKLKNQTHCLCWLLNCETLSDIQSYISKCLFISRHLCTSEHSVSWHLKCFSWWFGGVQGYLLRGHNSLRIKNWFVFLLSPPYKVFPK